MAKPKVITASDLRLGKLVIQRESSMLRIERRYVYLDAGSQVINNLTGGRVVQAVPLANLPAEIVTALAVIDNWTYQQALSQEGMADG